MEVKRAKTGFKVTTWLVKSTAQSTFLLNHQHPTFPRFNATCSILDFLCPVPAVQTVKPELTCECSHSTNIHSQKYTFLLGMNGKDNVRPERNH